MFSFKTLVLASTSIICLGTVIWLNQKPKQHNINLHEKSKHLKFYNQSHRHTLNSTEKLRLPVKVNFELLNGRTEPNKNMQLEVRIMPLQQLSEVKVRWETSDKVTFLNSSLKNFELKNLNVGQGHTWMADFKQSSVENIILNLYIEAKVGDTIMKSHYPFHSVNHTKIMQNAKDIQLRHEEYLRSDPKKLKLRE